jgi:organic radical activating enzyme
MEILKENQNDTLRKFMNTVKKSPTLLKQHYVFKNFEDCKPFAKERLAERFINQNLSILKGVKWQDIVKENKNIRITQLENSHVESTGGNKDELYNNIHTLIESFTRPGFSNIEEEQKSYEYLLEYLTRAVEEKETSKEKIDNPDLKNWQYITKLAVNNFNERYAHLNEEEKKVLSMLLADNNKKINHIEDLKKENLNLIDELLKEATDIKRVAILEGFKEKLNNKNFDAFNADGFIIAYSELNENLKSM